MNIPNEWVEKVELTLRRHYRPISGRDAGHCLCERGLGGPFRGMDEHDEHRARAVVEDLLPDILEAVARELEANDQPLGNLSRGAQYLTGADAAQIVRNLGVDSV